MLTYLYRTIIAMVLLCATSCGSRPDPGIGGQELADARYFSIDRLADGTPVVVSVSPYGDAPDTLVLSTPVRSVVCMSSTSVAGFSAIGAADVVTGISGKDYISDPDILDRMDEIVEVGYESDMQYEAIIRLHPDMVLAYSTSSVRPAYVDKLQSLGVRVMMIYDYLEAHPLARAEYLLFYGCLTGRQEIADSLFDDISDRYAQIRQAASSVDRRTRVLVNTPYADLWYVPGEDNYFTTLIKDAGGEVLGTMPGSESSVISMEKALELSESADVWLNPGWSTERAQIASLHPLIASFPVLNHGRIFNNIKRVTPRGGNDFWESGAVRPDLILSDLLEILHPELSAPDDSLEYYIEVK